MLSLKPTGATAAKIFGLALALGASLANANSSANEALAVCKAVVKDDASEVARLLADYRPKFEYSYSYLAPGGNKLRDAQKAFECNGLSLEDFAVKLGSQRTAVYLETGELGNAEYLADTQEESSKPKS